MSERLSTRLLEITLIADGSSDRALVPIVESVFDQFCTACPFVVRFADRLPTGALAPRLRAALAAYPCDVLLIHRDAENQSAAVRENEIARALLEVAIPSPALRIIPVRMTESWLLVDESAIRAASGNPQGRIRLALPRGSKVEKGDAKAALLLAIQAASELSPSRIRRLDFNRARQRVSELLDPSKLEVIPSFRHFRDQVRQLFPELV